MLNATSNPPFLLLHHHGLPAMGFPDYSYRTFSYLSSYIIPSTMISLITSDTRFEFCSPNLSNTDRKDDTNVSVESLWLDWPLKQETPK